MLTKKLPDEILKSSFRDPSGFMFSRNGVFYRQVNKSYKDNYDLLIKSGLHEALVNSGKLIFSEEVNVSAHDLSLAYKILKPNQIPFISYPYEWCYSQLLDAAILTLEIQEMAIEYGMCLKDASAFNVQFYNGKPIFIDTLSFTLYQKGEPWIAYRQFCKHFLAPLALMRYRDVSLNRLLEIFIDGIPLNLASTYLPLHTFLNFSLITHIHIHARAERYFSNKKIISSKRKNSMSEIALRGLINNLKNSIKSLGKPQSIMEWTQYYQETNYSNQAFIAKKNYLKKIIHDINPKVVWDLGANTGVFSYIAAEKADLVVSFDVDPTCVEKNYQYCLKNRQTKVLPIVQDLTNPSSSVGWGSEERLSFSERGTADLVMALALIHHLVISNNIPILHIVSFFSLLCRYLVIEFIPKTDSQVKKLLMNREDIFLDYSREKFETAFSTKFVIRSITEIDDSERILYFMEVIQK